MKLYQWNPDADGPLSEAALVNKLEILGYTCTRYTYPAGTCFPDHDHAVDKIDAVLQGSFKITMYGKSIILTPGCYVMVPKNTIHSAEVIGDEAVISIDAVKRN
jgi:quercetin dioxygenase-like cupin family protein